MRTKAQAFFRTYRDYYTLHPPREPATGERFDPRGRRCSQGRREKAVERSRELRERHTFGHPKRHGYRQCNLFGQCRCCGCGAVSVHFGSPRYWRRIAHCAASSLPDDTTTPRRRSVVRQSHTHQLTNTVSLPRGRLPPSRRSIHRSSVWKGYSEKFGCLLEPRFIHILASLCATRTCSVASYASRRRECAMTLTQGRC